MTAANALRAHWPEYLIEAWALGMFMVSAGVVTLLVESPASPLRAALPDPLLRRALIGLAMGLTAVALIYSRWGQRSGAHINPAVTLTYLALGRIAPWDATFYVIAQFVGASLGVVAVVALAGPAFAAPEVNYVATLPGHAGPAVAFFAELLISGGLMIAVLMLSAHPRLARLTGLCAGALVAVYVALEAPLSGMSMNPARSLASAAPAGAWRYLWIYFTAPPLGMLAAAGLYVLRPNRRPGGCAKLDHCPDLPCIHCGQMPLGGPPPVPSAARHDA
jgi:aquaporin Z